jgi:hypothetical protein
MIEHFEKGKFYICILRKRPIYFNRSGKMDKILDGKPHLCIYSSELELTNKESVLFDCFDREWIFSPFDFREYKKGQLDFEGLY